MSFRSSARRAGAIAAGIAAAAVATPVAIAAPTSHAKLWNNKSKSVTCGVEYQGKTMPAHWILCSAKGIPRPANANKNAPGDPYVEIAATGKPKLILISQYSYLPGAKAKTLTKGTTWSRLGVTCKLVSSKKVTCANGKGHGFDIGNGKYTKF
jgi:hypothetical protein